MALATDAHPSHPPSHSILHPPQHLHHLCKMSSHIPHFQPHSPCPTCTSPFSYVLPAVLNIVSIILTLRVEMGHQFSKLAARADNCLSLTAVANVISGKGAVEMYKMKWMNALQDRVSVFDSKHEANNPSIAAYLGRLARYGTVSNSVFVLMLLYIERICEHESPHFTLTPRNVHRMLAAAFVIASKWLEDRHPAMTTFAYVVGVDVDELEVLEEAFLKLIKYRTFVTVEEYAQKELEYMAKAMDTKQGMRIIHDLSYKWKIRGIENAVRQSTTWSSLPHTDNGCVASSSCEGVQPPQVLVSDAWRRHPTKKETPQMDADLSAKLRGVAMAQLAHDFPAIQPNPAPGLEQEAEWQVLGLCEESGLVRYRKLRAIVAIGKGADVFLPPLARRHVPFGAADISTPAFGFADTGAFAVDQVLTSFTGGGVWTSPPVDQVWMDGQYGGVPLCVEPTPVIPPGFEQTAAHMATAAPPGQYAATSLAAFERHLADVGPACPSRYQQARNACGYETPLPQQEGVGQMHHVDMRAFERHIDQVDAVEPVGVQAFDQMGCPSLPGFEELIRGIEQLITPRLDQHVEMQPGGPPGFVQHDEMVEPVIPNLLDPPVAQAEHAGLAWVDPAIMEFDQVRLPNLPGAETEPTVLPPFDPSFGQGHPMTTHGYQRSAGEPQAVYGNDRPICGSQPPIPLGLEQVPQSTGLNGFYQPLQEVQPVVPGLEMPIDESHPIFTHGIGEAFEELEPVSAPVFKRAEEESPRPIHLFDPSDPFAPPRTTESSGIPFFDRYDPPMYMTKEEILASYVPEEYVIKLEPLDAHVLKQTSSVSGSEQGTEIVEPDCSARPQRAACRDAATASSADPHDSKRPIATAGPVEVSAECTSSKEEKPPEEEPVAPRRVRRRPRKVQSTELPKPEQEITESRATRQWVEQLTPIDVVGLDELLEDVEAVSPLAKQEKDAKASRKVRRRPRSAQPLDRPRDEQKSEVDAGPRGLELFQSPVRKADPVATPSSSESSNELEPENVSCRKRNAESKTTRKARRRPRKALVEEEKTPQQSDNEVKPTDISVESMKPCNEQKPEEVADSVVDGFPADVEKTTGKSFRKVYRRPRSLQVLTVEDCEVSEMVPLAQHVCEELMDIPEPVDLPELKQTFGEEDAIVVRAKRHLGNVKPAEDVLVVEEGVGDSEPNCIPLEELVEETLDGEILPNIGVTSMTLSEVEELISEVKRVCPPWLGRAMARIEGIYNSMLKKARCSSRGSNNPGDFTNESGRGEMTDVVGQELGKKIIPGTGAVACVNCVENERERQTMIERMEEFEERWIRRVEGWSGDMKCITPPWSPNSSLHTLTPGAFSLISAAGEETEEVEKLGYAIMEVFVDRTKSGELESPTQVTELRISEGRGFTREDEKMREERRDKLKLRDKRKWRLHPNTCGKCGVGWITKQKVNERITVKEWKAIARGNCRRLAAIVNRMRKH